MGKLFGTDGLRGVASVFPLDQASIELLGRVLFFLLKDRDIEPEIIIGRDTRESGPVLFNALCRGFSSAGGRVDDAGILSTPALAYLAQVEKKCAVSITASHNPYQDNGIKIFGPDGYKLSEEVEAEIEPYLLGEKSLDRTDTIPECNRNSDFLEYFRSEYKEYLVRSLFRDLNLKGLKIAIDCANGALCEVAPAVFRAMGAEVKAFHNQPNGQNINDHCGALYPHVLYGYVQENGFDAGFTFDGDGDRCMAADKTHVYDGDYILAAAALYLKAHGKLKKNAVVGTAMSNMGLEVFLRNQGIHLYRVPVGDKNVLEKLQEEDLSLGGEQSGHIIFMNDSFIGDGLLTALQVLRILKESGSSLAQFCTGFTKYPQILLNVSVKSKPDLQAIPEIHSAISKLEEELKSSGRILVRYSGTEPLARIMIEGPEQSRIESMAASLAEIVRNKLG
ncbi:MAG TPA: phosphoglucosamine mutase [Acidobacteriota bacterium]|nr:phosphoglucosamine mutase [Acidobacteriota bacterium]